MSEFSDRLEELMRTSNPTPTSNRTKPEAAVPAAATTSTAGTTGTTDTVVPGPAPTSGPRRTTGTPPARLPGARPAKTAAPAVAVAAAPPPTSAPPAPGGSHRDTTAPPASAPVPAPSVTATTGTPVVTGSSLSQSPKGRPAADRFDDLKGNVHEELLVQLGPKLYDADLNATELEAMVRQALGDVMAASEQPLTSNDRQRITQEIADDILGYGPIEPYLRDESVAEIMVNGPFDIWLERKGRLVRVDGKFNDEAHLRRTIDKIVSRIGRRIDEASPMVDARLPDGSRVNAVVPPLAIDGSVLTIRKFATDPLTVEHLIEFGSLSRKTAEFLEACVKGRLNVIVSGGTGAGKTTTLNVLSSFIPSDERIVTIEDAAELQLKQAHVVRLESRPSNIEGKGEVSIRDLVRNSLRMRPDRIVVGEVRDASALDMLQAMNTGHDGSICTVHSNGPRDTLARLETLVLMAGMDLPMRAIREQVASAVDVIVHQARLKDGTRRITHVTEVERMEGDVITLQDIFLFDNNAGFDEDGLSMGSLRATGLRPKFLDKMAHSNVTVDPRTFIPEQA
ncbi:MAG: putative conjugal transfer protein [Marmoricola sp.]|nr:putative conjugal transfer protein [Marmoricola sp.]